jgi:hypothetical protein
MSLKNLDLKSEGPVSDNVGSSGSYMPGLSKEAQAVRDQYFTTGTIPKIGIVQWKWWTPWTDGSVQKELTSNLWKPAIPIILTSGAVIGLVLVLRRKRK